MSKEPSALALAAWGPGFLPANFFLTVAFRVAASPLTRSSYHAGDDFKKMQDARNAQLARSGAGAAADAPA